MLAVASSALAPNSQSIWHAVADRPWWWIDFVIFGALMLVQLATAFPRPGDSRNKIFAANSLQGATTGGLTVAGILLPLSLLAVNFRAESGSTALSANSLADFFLASCWLMCSLAAGLYVLFTVAIRGPREDIVKNLDVRLLFGAQLFLLFVSCFRLVWAISSVTTASLK